MRGGCGALGLNKTWPKPNVDSLTPLEELGAKFDLGQAGQNQVLAKTKQPPPLLLLSHKSIDLMQCTHFFDLFRQVFLFMLLV